MDVELAITDGPHPFRDLLGFSVQPAGPGRATASLQVAEEHRNVNGVVHGAVLFALADTAMGLAVMTLQEPGKRTASTDVHLRFVRPVHAGRIDAEVQVRYAGRRHVTLDGELRVAGELVATATGAFVVLG